MSRKGSRRSGSLHPASAEAEQALELFTALAEGLLGVIGRLKPSYKVRVECWMARVIDEYSIRRHSDGADRARAWLLAELRAPQLPDGRQVARSRKADETLVRTFDELKAALAPAWAIKLRQGRAAAVAKIVSRVLSKTVQPDALPVLKNRAELCYTVLNTDPVRVSRARRRLDDRNRRHGLEAIRRLEAWASSLKVEQPARATYLATAATELRQEIERLYTRRPVR